MASVEVYDIGSTSFSVKLKGLLISDADGTSIQYTRLCKWIANDLTDSTLTNAEHSSIIYPGNTQGGDYTFTNMIAGHQYTVICNVYRMNPNPPDDLIASLQSDSFYTDDESSGGDTQTWTLNKIEDDVYLNRSTAVEHTVVLERYTLYRIRFSCTYDGEVTLYSSSNIDTIGFLSTSTMWSNVDGMPTNDITYDDDSGLDANFSITRTVKAGTVYYAWFRGNRGTEIGYDVTIHINPPKAPSQTTKPTRWDWTDSNGKATKEQTVAAYNAVKEKQETLNFNYLVWDDMVDKVKAILDYSGATWISQSSGGYATYANTKMKKGGYVYPIYFNSLRYNIDSHCLTGIEEQNHGDYVYGWYIIRLAECINAWLDSI